MKIFFATFVGKNTATLCSSVVEVAQQDVPHLVSLAKQIAAKFEKAFTLFGDCHAIYDSKIVTDDDIKTLGRYLI